MRPSLIKHDKSMLTFSAMLLHKRASGRDAHVADAVPPLAEVRIDMQSVLILGGKAFAEITKSMAHNSAAAAVAILEGGLPDP